jgi:cardiolipin synthase
MSTDRRVSVESGQLIVSAWYGLRTLPWHWFALAVHLLLAGFAILHVLLYKRDPRAALGWVAVCLLFPLLGPLLYYLFGINRIQTQARKLARLPRFRLQIGYERGAPDMAPPFLMQPVDEPLSRFLRVSDRVTARQLTAGNRVEVLENGEQAYPAMLAAIRGAAKRILLVTYLFEADTVGEAFAAALVDALRRGVDVCVIVDGVGELYSRPRISRRLRRAGVRVARFLPPRLLPPSFSLNLRNHRKMLVVDGSSSLYRRHEYQFPAPARAAIPAFNRGPAFPTPGCGGGAAGGHLCR